MQRTMPETVLYLEEDGILGVSPEVRHRVAAVALARLYLQSAGALSIGTGLVLLLLSRLVANGRSKVNLVAVLEDAVAIAQQHPQTGLLEDVHLG